MAGRRRTLVRRWGGERRTGRRARCRGLAASRHPLLATYLTYRLPFSERLGQRRLVI